MRKTVLVIALTSLFAVQALAKESRIRIQEELDIDPNSTLHINVPVGEFILDTHSSNSIDLNIEVSGKDNGWFSNDDVSNAKLTTRVENGHIYLEVDKEDTSQEWVIKVPTSVHLDLNMGVGEAKIENLRKDLNIDVGVGEVTVDLGNNDYARIDLDSGVGEVDLRGFKSVNHNKAMVSESAEWHGSGEHEIEIDVGVGEIEVRH